MRVAGSNRGTSQGMEVGKQRIVPAKPLAEDHNLIGLHLRRITSCGIHFDRPHPLRQVLASDAVRLWISVIVALSENCSSGWAPSLVGSMKKAVENRAQRERMLPPDRLSRRVELRRNARGMRLASLVEISAIRESRERTGKLAREAEAPRSTICRVNSTRNRLRSQRTNSEVAAGGYSQFSVRRPDIRTTAWRILARCSRRMSRPRRSARYVRWAAGRWRRHRQKPRSSASTGHH